MGGKGEKSAAVDADTEASSNDVLADINKERLKNGGSEQGFNEVVLPLEEKMSSFYILWV
jgi:hypothetical protein